MFLLIFQFKSLEHLLLRQLKKMSEINERKKNELLHKADIFLYPLNPFHYGTCDQTLQEAAETCSRKNDLEVFCSALQRSGAHAQEEGHAQR